MLTKNTTTTIITATTTTTTINGDDDDDIIKNEWSSISVLSLFFCIYPIHIPSSLLLGCANIIKIDK